MATTPSQQSSQTPEQALYQRETTCPSCGRFVGVYERCPYCQAWTPKRLSIRIFKTFAVLTSTVGLLLLLFFARTIRTPEIKISEIGPLTNFAHVRLTGVVERSFGLHPQWHSLGFTLSQPGIGSEPLSIRVSAYAKVAVEIDKQGKVPDEGDEISVEGTVRYQKDTPSLLINAPEHLQILRRFRAPQSDAPLAAADVTSDMLGKVVTVQGVIAESVTFPRGALIRLADQKEGFAVWVPARTWDDMKTAVHVGDEITARGKVKTFRDALEVEVTAANGIKLLRKGVQPASDATLPSEGRDSTTATPEPKLPDAPGPTQELATTSVPVAEPAAADASAAAPVATEGGK
ncbi:MAG TPA: hypothetical protein VIV61_06430 [Candidatus Ozemobacteraceae bacterium]